MSYLRNLKLSEEFWCLRKSSGRTPCEGLMLSLFAVTMAAAWSPQQPRVRPTRTLMPPPDLSRQWLLQELASELLAEERAPSKGGCDFRHPSGELSAAPSFPYVSTVATPTRSSSCRMMVRGKRPVATSPSSRRSKPEPEPAQPVAAMLQGVATIVSATGAAAGALVIAAFASLIIAAFAALFGVVIATFAVSA